jgi:hypothetical protein
VVREIHRRGCMIPQTAYSEKPHYVIRGELAKPGQIDWAVLCSVKGVSMILVFWDGSEENPAEIAALEDRIFLQGVSPDKIAVFERNHACRKGLHHAANTYGGPKPPPIDHQGIDDAFLEKASVVWYFLWREVFEFDGSGLIVAAFVPQFSDWPEALGT